MRPLIRKRSTAGWMMLLPVLAGLGAFFIYPFVYLIGLSFSKSTLANTFQKWVGWDNFDWMFTGTNFTSSIATTVIFAITVSIVQLILGLLIAYLLYTSVKNGRVLRALILLPLMTPPVMVGIAWKLLLSPTGWINSLLSQAGLIEQPISILGDQRFAFPSIMLADTWQWTPFIVILSYAALQSLPEDVFEAAALDGAHARTTFFKLTLPMLAPALLSILLIRMIMAFKTFDLVFVLTQGGPGGQTDVSTYTIWRTALQEFDLGLAGAQTLLFAIVISLVTLPIVFLNNKAEARL
ncbi:carbohydrate ABC transporter permease [Pacificoceanicola onchidii]|uniref:carbohydrate ABC transporter permease n=1 Tax=Pacificoceanicola onchidii TaxID=2562685 RepID=UPI0010A4EE0E|nr:sugar ABC transporter permease [Pacificoceanicola onchidii]